MVLKKKQHYNFLRLFLFGYFYAVFNLFFHWSDTAHWLSLSSMSSAAESGDEGEQIKLLRRPRCTTHNRIGKPGIVIA